MKKAFICLLAGITLFSAGLYAQGPKATGEMTKKYPAREKFDPGKMVESQGIMICNELGLDKEKSVEFMEVYRQYCGSLHKIVSKHTRFRPDQSEEEIEEMILQGFEISEEMNELRKEYYTIFRRILSPSQIQKMYFIEKHKASQFGPRPN